MATAIEIKGRAAQANESSSRSRPWFVFGATDESDAISTVNAAAPGTLDGLVKRNVEVDEEIEGGYRCSVNYGQFQAKEPPAKGESQFNFELGLQPQRIYVPLETQSVYKRDDDPLGIPSDVARWLIGDQGLGQGPEGAEVYEPTVAFSETHWIDEATLTEAYRVSLMRTVGKINAGAFKGWDAGEVLCAGISGAKRGSDDWEVSFKFQARENQTDLVVAGITVASKGGWEYLWPRYFKKLDGDSYVTLNLVRYMVVAKVFRSADFSVLGI